MIQRFGRCILLPVFIREAARCRAASDRAMDIVKAWEHGHSPAAVSVVCPHCDDRLPLSSVCGIDVTLPPEQIEVCAASCPQCHGSVKLMLLLTG